MDDDQQAGAGTPRSRAVPIGVATAAACLVAGGVAAVTIIDRDPATPAPTAFDIAVPAYVFPDDPFLARLLDPAMPAPAVVVLNLDNGDGDVTVLDEVADKLRARRTADGRPVRVLGYVWTGSGPPVSLRPIADVQARVDRWLEPRGGTVHYDGIFFDVTTVACGPEAGSLAYRDHYRDLRRYVQGKLTDRPAFVVNNPGAAVPACYLDPAHRTADVFVTFEGSAAAYAATADAPAPDGGYWLGGNVTADGAYVTGDRFAVDGRDVEVGAESFWHIVHTTPAGGTGAVLDQAASRHVGHVYVTDGAPPGNPYDTVPVELATELDRAAASRR